MNSEKGKIIIGKPYVKKVDDEIKLCADVDWMDKEETVWFSVDKEYGAFLTDDRADAFVVGLLMTAMYMNMDIKCEVPLTRRLHYQLNHYLIPVMSANLKGLYPIHIYAEITDDILPCASAVGMSWSDDVDSLYTLKEHLSMKQQGHRLTHVLMESHGVLDKIDNPEKFGIQKIDIEKLGLNVVGVNSNLSELLKDSFSGATTFYQAAIVLALQKLFGVFLKPAKYEVKNFSFDENDCSHYDLATLGFLETDVTTFYSAGGGYSYEYKLKELADFTLAQKCFSPYVR